MQSFAELANRLIAFHPPKNDAVAEGLDAVREAFAALVDSVDELIPEGADATLAARSIHRACQDTLAAIVLNQD